MPEAARKQWDGRSRGGRWGYQFFAYALRLLGLRSAYCFLALVVIYFIPFAPRSTRALWRYHRRIRGLGRLASLKELYCHYYVFGQTLIDRMAIRAGMSGKFRFSFDCYERFLEIINGPQGVVVIGAHVGNWEAGGVFFGKYGRKMNIVMLDAEHQRIKELLEEHAEADNNYKVIALGEDGIAAMLRIKAALDRGEYVCFNGDRYMDDKAARPHSFLGKVAPFPTGPFRIAATCDVPVVFYYAVREPGRSYRFIFEEYTGPRKDAGQLTQQYLASLERIVRQYPRQWFNFYDFWE